MPRFFGRDYYNEDLIARRELTARACLIVPRRLKDENEDDQTASYFDISGICKQDFLGYLQPFTEPDETMSFPLDLEVCSKTVSGVEQLQWATRWKEFDGNYIEIVPSSNPESESSTFDSQPDSLPDTCVTEEFCTFPLQQIMKVYRDYLEEPVYFRPSALPSTSLSDLLKSSTEELDSVSTVIATIEDEHVSETAFFGKSDHHLHTTPEMATELLSESCLLQAIEKFELHHFPPARAEELMYPVPCDVEPPSSSSEPSDTKSGLVHEAHTACIELDLQKSPPLPPSVRLDKDVNEPNVSELVTAQQTREKGLESLLMSPITKPCLTGFLSMNEQVQDKDEVSKLMFSSAALESPLYMQTSSPAHFDQMIEDTFLQPWSPHKLTDLSPLLNVRGISTMEGKLRYGEACYGGIQTVKFPEPQMYKQIQEADEKLDTLTEAVNLASSLDLGANIGQIELDLTWDITPPHKCSLSQFRPESLFIASSSQPQRATWKLSVNFQTVEAMVETEIERTKIQDREVVQADSVDHLEDVGDTLSALDESGLCENLIIEESMKNEIFASTGSTAFKMSDSKSCASVASFNSQGSTFSWPFSTNTAENEPKIGSCIVVHNPLKGDMIKNINKPTERNTSCIQMSNTDRVKSDVDVPRERNTSCEQMNNSKLAESEGEKKLTDKTLDILETPTVLSGKRQDTRGAYSRTLSLPSADISSKDENTDITGNGHQPTKGVTDCKTQSPRAEDPVQPRFDLQLDEEDWELDMGSDFFDDIASPGPDKKEKSTTISSCFAGAPFDPVDNFLLMRDARTTGTKTLDMVKGHSVVKSMDKSHTQTRAHAGIITPMSVRPHSIGDSDQRFLTVSLSGPYVKALEEMCSQAEPHVDRLKAEGVVSRDAMFMLLKPDYTRFLLKDRMTKLQSASSQEESKDDTYKSVAVIHTLCSAAHMLQYCCLESAIVHLGAMQEKHTVLTGTLEGLRKTLFQYQFTAQQTRQLHPKVAAVCREIQQHKLSHPSPHKVVVVMRREQPTLLKTLQSAISLDGTVAKPLGAIDIQQRWPDDCECILTWDQAAVSTLVQLCSLVVEYEADPQSPLCNTCQTENVHYVGLSLQETQVTMSERDISSEDKGVTVIGSQHLVQHQQLLQLLETRHNIIVVRRDYANMGHVHHPDVVVSVHKGAVLLHAKQLTEEGGLERLTERLTAVGLQLSTVWILLHSLGDTTRNAFRREVEKKLVHLEALMANLSSSAKGFTAGYKVLLCRTAGDIAMYLSHLATHSATRADGRGVTTDNIPPPVELGKEEKFLLGIPCLNPFSCHLLLSRATVGEILTMSLDQLRSLVPELPETVTENLYRVVNMDRGLQLRPQITDQRALQAMDHSHHSDHIVTHPNRSFQSDEPDEVQTHFPTNQEIEVLSSRSPIPEDSVAYQYQDTERFDYNMPPDMSEPTLPLTLSGSLHYTDQPTPFLSGQQTSQKSRGFSRKDIYRNENCNIPPDSVPVERSLTTSFISHSCKTEGLNEEFQRDPERKRSTGISASHSEFLHKDTLNGKDYSSDSVYRERDFVNYQGTRKSLAHPALSLPAKDQQRVHASTGITSWMEGADVDTICFSTSGAMPPPLSRSSNSTDNDSFLQTTISYAPQISVERVQPVLPSVVTQKCEPGRFPKQRREFDINSASVPFRHLADQTGTEAEADSNSHFLSPCSKYIKTNSYNPVPSNSTLSSNWRFDVASSSVETGGEFVEGKSTVRGYQEGRHRPNSQWDDNCFWSNASSVRGHGSNRQINQHETYNNHNLFQMKAQINHDETYDLPQNQSLGYPCSTEWHANSSDSCKPLHFSGHTTGHCMSNNHALSTQSTDFGRRSLGALGYQSAMTEGSDCLRTSNEISDTGDNAVPSADFQQLDYGRPLGGNSVYYSPSFESSTHVGDVDTRHPQCTTGPSNSRPSFTEDLAATTRRLLQGKSPGRLYGAHHRPQTPVHRISIGLAQPLRREVTTSQESDKSKGPVVPHLSSNSSEAMNQQASSPPLDMDWEMMTGDEQQHRISEAKLKKWSAHLQFRNKQDTDPTYSNTCSNQEEQCPSAEKKRAIDPGRRLTYQAIPGTGGQTRLAFL